MTEDGSAAMTEELPPHADVFVDEKDTSGTEVPLVGALSGLGLTTRVKAVPVRRGPEQLEWLILATLPLQAFLGGLGSKLADDAYRKLRDAVRRTPPAPTPRPVVIEDRDTGVRVLLTPDLDEAAYRQLREIDLALVRGTIRYDTVARAWRLVEDAEGTA
ncbi:hypothetical protein [Streptomyces sp. NBC_01304]|uniref:hypothetical protein n=1 Tax=Streptomyces sp. NBC_01304 TaxID=2903818 RepID=UPI002E163C82|nr:hypothetical protein OG430_16345 [Streptomyces sp. NBC_01304]